MGREVLRTLEVYDPTTDTWQSLPSMPTPRDHLAVAVVNGLLYAIGGRRGAMSRNVAVNEVYDPKANRWITRAPMPTARGGIAAAVVGDRLYVFGGENPDQTFENTEAYDPKTDRWVTLKPMPTARHGLGAVSWEGHIYVIGGGPSPGGSRSNVNEVFIPPQ